MQGAPLVRQSLIGKSIPRRRRRDWRVNWCFKVTNEVRRSPRRLLQDHLALALQVLVFYPPIEAVLTTSFHGRIVGYSLFAPLLLGSRVSGVGGDRSSMALT